MDISVNMKSKIDIWISRRCHKLWMIGRNDYASCAMTSAYCPDIYLYFMRYVIPFEPALVDVLCTDVFPSSALIFYILNGLLIKPIIVYFHILSTKLHCFW